MVQTHVDFRYLVLHRMIDTGHIVLTEGMNRSAMGIASGCTNDPLQNRITAKKYRLIRNVPTGILYFGN